MISVTGTPKYAIGTRLYLEWAGGCDRGTVDGYAFDDNERLMYYMCWDNDAQENGGYTLRDLIALRAEIVAD